eukprot:jgi/Undpi1/9943/HiC_scaffold_28.g12397.m1
MVPPEATGPVQADPKASAVTFQEGSNAAAGGKMEARSGQPPSSRQIAVLRQKSGKTISDPQSVLADEFGAGPKDEPIDNIRVQKARLRVRVSRLKNGHAKGRRLRPGEKEEEQKLNLTFRMMLGVRVAVGRQANLADEDRYVFPPAGTEGRFATPSHKLNKTFKFRDYAPKAFRKLREVYGIDESSYMYSVAGDYDYLELITNSKSGSFFFYSHDQKYIIKNMKRAEAAFFLRILPQYYEHHRTHPDSVLIRFCGMYLVNRGRKKTPFIVMKCVDGLSPVQIHTKYDLKGSTVHRTAKDGEKVLKDNNLRKANGTFKLGSQRDAFLEVMRADAEFLCSVNVMDYSMFVSVHDKTRPPERILRRKQAEFFTFADEADDRRVPAFKRFPSSRAPSSPVGEEGKAESSEDSGEGNGAMPVPAQPSAGGSVASKIRYRPDGGIDSEGDGADEVYWLGVIDVLQVYTRMKHAETWYKGLGRTKSELSCVDPELYCKRFVSFMAERTC